MAIKKGSKKTLVVEELFNSHGLDRIVTADEVKAAIEKVDPSLNQNNPANFLKDLIRKTSVNANWPAALTQAKVSARQRYGSSGVLEFFRHPDDWPTPFVDRFRPTEETPVYTVQTASLPYLARSLGRREEAGLIQMTVNQRVVETQLSVFSAPELMKKLREISHLQMSVKTQPEIDALFVASYNRGAKPAVGQVRNVLVTCEAKQRNERILEDQIREQVRMGFRITAKLKDVSIEAVKPMAVQVVQREREGFAESMIFMVEFDAFEREAFVAAYSDPDPEVYWTLPLIATASTLFRFSPSIKAVGLPQKIKPLQP